MRRLAACLALLSWLSLAEWKLFERLLYTRPENTEFVLFNVQGILAGTPVYKSWQQRYLGPLLVAAIGTIAPDRLSALQAFHGLLLLAANLLLFILLRRRGATLQQGLLAVVAFGFAHLLLVYGVEYPWDWIDVLLFVTFGAWVARGGALAPLWPLLLIGAFNHETVLYLPLWYLLAPPRRQQALAGAALLALGGVALALRHTFYRGRPDLPGQVFEELTPLIDNPIHALHNVSSLFVHNWTAGRGWISVGLLAAIGVLAWQLVRRPAYKQAAWWSLVVLGTIVLFGYINETRLYLPLLAFWVAYAWAPQPAR